MSADRVVRLQVTSEGTELVTEDTLYAIHVQAFTRAVDGQLLDNSRDFYAPAEGKLPDAETLGREVRALVAELMALRTAPVIDPYTGPAILAPEATGVLFHEAVGHRLEGERLHDDNEGRTFKGQVGKGVLPTFLSVIDDPTAHEEGGAQLNGRYRYDDEGVAAQRTVLVEGGVLRAYLLSRKPVQGFTRSNGHGRAQANRTPMARMANLFVRSEKRVPAAELRRMLIAEAKRAKKPYALLIKDITGGNTNTSSYGYQAFKGVPRMVYRIDVATGKEELVRGVLADHPQERFISLLAISVSHLETCWDLQLELPLALADETRRPGSRRGMARWSADRAIDDIRDRYGWEAVGYGSVALGSSRSVPDAFRELAEKDL